MEFLKTFAQFSVTQVMNYKDLIVGCVYLTEIGVEGIQHVYHSIAPHHHLLITHDYSYHVTHSTSQHALLSALMATLE